MSDLPVIATAFVSGFVAPSTIAWYALTSQRREQERLTREELRSVLDEAAHALGDSRRAIDDIGKLWARGVPAPHADVRSALGQYQVAAAAAQDANDRVSIRLRPDDDAARSFHTAARSLDRCGVKLAPYLQGAATAADRAGFEAQRASFRDDLGAYYAAARATAADEHRTAPRVAAIVVAIFAIVGAALLGAAIGASEADRGLRVNGSEVQQVVVRNAPRAARYDACRPVAADGLGPWTCAPLDGSRPGPIARATVLDDGRVFVRLDGEAGRETCCVSMR